VTLSTIYKSGFIEPETRASPKPVCASITIFVASLSTGCFENATPEVLASMNS